MTEPYCLNPAGQRDGPDPPDRMMPVEVRYDKDLEAWIRPYFMAPMNAKNVRRSNALLGYPYGDDFRYEEARVAGKGALGWLKGMKGAIGSGGFLQAMALPPTRRLLKKYVLPKSGEGPSREVRETGFFHLILIGKLDDGTVVRARVRGEGDPGVESTSRMLAESALCLVQDSDKISVGGGFWTPASAMGELLLARLVNNAGLSFQLD